MCEYVKSLPTFGGIACESLRSFHIESRIRPRVISISTPPSTFPQPALSTVTN